MKMITGDNSEQLHSGFIRSNPFGEMLHTPSGDYRELNGIG